jgi:5-formyltetrahydrofolate cyclo-ligase
MVDFINQQKKELRRHFLRQRQQLDPVTWQRNSREICQNLQRMPEFQQARSVLAFTSFRQEPDLSSLYYLTERSVMDDSSIVSKPLVKQWGFSRCFGKELSWHQYQPGRSWVSGAYGIREPAKDWPQVNLAEVDLILVPAIACDRTGGRLGYGGGFYDRFLAKIKRSSIMTIGIVFSMAYCDQLPLEIWDRSLDFICTEVSISPRIRS